MYNRSLALMTGVDIPIPECAITLHQPTIEEISFLGETAFFTGIQLICLKKEMYIQDNKLLADVNNFELFMQLMNAKNNVEQIQDTKQTLQMLFPQYQVTIGPRSILFNKDKEFFNIDDEEKFEFLQNVVRQMTCLKQSEQDTFNPANAEAKRIADKIMEGRKKVAELNKDKGSMLGQYLSIITVGFNSMSLKDCINLTLYQLYDLIERYSLYINWDLDIRAKLAGADSKTKVENWMKNIH